MRRFDLIAGYLIDGGKPGSPVIGRLVDKGLHNELTAEAYAAIDGTDGRAHQVRFRGVEASEQAPPIGGIFEIRHFGRPDDPRPMLVVANRSDLNPISRSPHPGRPGLTIDSSSAILCRSPWAGVVARRATPCKRETNTSLANGSPGGRASASSCSAMS